MVLQLDAGNDAGVNEETLLRRIVAESGVFLRREAEAIGYDDRTIQQRVRSRAWIRVRHGCYTFPDIWTAADDIERFRIHGRAALRTHDARAVLTHTSSLAQHEVALWDPDLSVTHLTRRDGTNGRNGKDVTYHKGGLEDRHVGSANGLPVTAIDRAVVEHLLITGVESGLVTADNALHKQLLTPESLDAMHAEMASWPGALQAGLVLRLADGRSESVGETRSRYLMWSQGLPMPELQYEVRDPQGKLIGITDFAWPGYAILGEFDGRIKYGRLLKPGEDPGEAVFREKKREDLLRAVTGWRVVRITWADLYKAEATAAFIRSLLRQAA